MACGWRQTFGCEHCRRAIVQRECYFWLIKEDHVFIVSTMRAKCLYVFTFSFSLNCVYSVIVFTGFYLWFRPLGGRGEGVNVKLSITHWLQCIHVLNAAKFWKRKLGCTLIKRNVNKVVSVHLRSCLLQVHFFLQTMTISTINISSMSSVGTGCKFHQDSEQLGLHAPITNNGLRILTVHD